MKQTLRARAAIGLAAAMLAGASLPASAQTPASAKATVVQLQEFECVSKTLSDELARRAANMWLANSTDGADVVEAGMRKAAEPCVARYSWNADTTDLALRVALYDVVIDLIAEDLKDLGAAKTDQLWDFWRALPTADRAYFLAAGSEAEDKAFVARMRPALVKFGLPDTDTAMGDAFALLEAISGRDDAIGEWMASGPGAAGN